MWHRLAARLRRAKGHSVLPPGFTFLSRAGGRWLGAVPDLGCGAGSVRAGGQTGLTRPRGSQAPHPRPIRSEERRGEGRDSGRESPALVSPGILGAASPPVRSASPGAALGARRARAAEPGLPAGDPGAGRALPDSRSPGRAHPSRR